MRPSRSLSSCERGDQLLAYDPNVLELGEMILGPIVEKVRNGSVEPLVVGAPRLVYVVVYTAERHALNDRSCDRRVGPINQEHPLCGRIDLPCAGQQVGPVHVRHPLVGEHEGHLISLRLALPQPLQGGPCRCLGLYAIVGSVTVAELGLDLAEGIRLVVHDEQDRFRRASPGDLRLRGGLCYPLVEPPVGFDRILHLLLLAS